MRRTAVRHTRKLRGGGWFNGVKRLFGVGRGQPQQQAPAPAPIRVSRPSFANLNEPTNENLRQQQADIQAEQESDDEIIQDIHRQARERGIIAPSQQPPLKKPTWRNRLKSGWSRFTKTVRNRLPGRRPSVPVPPTPPQVTPPGTPPPANEPVLSITREAYLASAQESVEDAYYRTLWYLFQRLDGRTHAELLPSLNRPNGMKLTEAQIQDLKQRLQPVYEALKQGNDAEFERLKSELLGDRFDKELNNWERGIPATAEEKSRLCYSDSVCKLYAGTRAEQFAQGNVANYLTRLLPKLFTMTPRKLRNLSNLEGSTCTTQTKDCIFVVNPNGLQQTDFMIGTDDFTRLSPKLRLLAISKDYLYSTPITTLTYGKFPNQRYIHDAIAAGAVILISPHLALDIMKNFSELYTLMFRSNRWKTMPQDFRLRMVTFQYFIAVQMVEENLPLDRVREVFTQFPNPALNYTYTLDADTKETFDTYFLDIQHEFKVKPMPLDKYLNLLKPLANQQMRSSIVPRIPRGANAVANWGTRRLPRAGRIEQEANTIAASRRNASKRLLKNIRSGQPTLGELPRELRVSANLSRPLTQAQRSQVNRTIGSAFNNTRRSRPRPSAYEPIE